MNFKFERDLTDNVFKTTIKFESFGDSVLSAEEEKSLIEDFGPAIVDLGGDYIGKFKLDADKNIVSDDTTGDEIKFTLNSTRHILNESFSVVFLFDAKTLSKADMVSYPGLASTYKVAECKCMLFEKEVQKRIENKLKALKEQKTGFETNTPQNFTV